MKRTAEETKKLLAKQLQELETMRRGKIENILVMVEDEQASNLIRPYLEYFSEQIGRMERRLGWLEMTVELFQDSFETIWMSRFGTAMGQSPLSLLTKSPTLASEYQPDPEQLQLVQVDLIELAQERSSTVDD